MEEKVEREEKEERVDTTVDTNYVKSSVKLCTTIKLSSNEMRNVLGRSLNLPFMWNTVYNSISLSVNRDCYSTFHQNKWMVCTIISIYETCFFPFLFLSIFGLPVYIISMIHCMPPGDCWLCMV